MAAAQAASFEHESWSSESVFLLATIGGAVGLGNLWRFPFLAGQNGGGAFVLVYIFFVVVLCLPLAADAIDRSLCADDGVTLVPPFAKGRDGDQCLLVDPGNGEPPVRFQYEQFNQTGVSPGCKKPSKQTTVIGQRRIKPA